MDLFKIALRFQVNGRVIGRRRVLLGGSGRLEGAELAIHEGEYLCVGDVARGGQHQAIGSKPISKTLAQRLAIETPHRFRCAENGPPKRMARPKSAGENFVQQIFRIVEIHLDFFEDHLALFFYVFGIEFRA